MIGDFQRRETSRLSPGSPASKPPVKIVVDTRPGWYIMCHLIRAVRITPPKYSSQAQKGAHHASSSYSVTVPHTYVRRRGSAHRPRHSVGVHRSSRQTAGDLLARPAAGTAAPDFPE